MTLDDEKYAAWKKKWDKEQADVATKIAEFGVDEAAMRDSKAPWPKTPEELSAYIATLVDRPHDYGTSAYAMSLAATAAFQYVAGVLGCTGFQASCADMDILRRTRSIKGPFMLIDGEQMLYPQYDIPARVAEALDGWREWAAEEAKKRLAEDGGTAHLNVKARWEELAAYEKAQV